MLPALVLTTTLLLLSACGGGASGRAPAPAATPSYGVSGTLSVASNLVLDSDTNDPNQAARAANDDLAHAQAVAAGGQVLGTVNRPGSGPDGATRIDGDENDAYRLTLAAGQTVELEFGADAASNDLDLYVYADVGGVPTVVGESYGTGRFECVTALAPGDYTVVVNAYAGASGYQLRVAEPGGGCDNTTALRPSAERLRPGEWIVALNAGSARAPQAKALLAAEPLQVLRGSAAPGRAALLGWGSGRQQALGANDTALRRQLGSAALQHLDTIATLKALRASAAFDQVLANRVVQASVGALVGAYPPNDPAYRLQRWHYEQIGLPAAMDRIAALPTHDAARPIVAVVDTGIVADHPDLAPQLVAGYDFVRDPKAGADGDGLDDNPDDLRSPAQQPTFHGSHVAGIVAAATFDGQGGAGIAPMAQLMPLRVLGTAGSGSFYDVFQALRYAAGLENDSGRVPARRADVVNLSLGAQGVGCDADTARLFAAVRAAGTLVVAASGNDSDRPQGLAAPVSYPANCAGVYAVTATNPQRGIAYYANTGRSIAFAAPGGDMRFSSNGSGESDGIYSTLAAFDAGGRRVPTHGLLQGTSMATPHVAGVLALLRWLHPALTPAQFDTLLAQGQLTDDAGAVGRDTLYGWGVINAAKAVQAVLTLRDGGAPAADGVLEALPAALDFGPLASELEFSVRATGFTNEKVLAIASSSAAVAVSALDVDAAGLGSYRLVVDRAALPPGLSTATVTVTTNARTLQVPLTIDQRRSSGATRGDLGPVYVMVYDATTNELLKQVTVQPADGQYRYSVGGLLSQSVYVVAGSDYDNDGFICSRGEACGAYPVLGAHVTPVMLTADRRDLDFVLEPVAGSVEAATASPARQRWR